MKRFRTAVPLAALAVVTACSETDRTPTGLIERPAAAITVTPSPTGAKVDTDKEDYSPGETVLIIGTGWAPGETVHLHLAEDPVADGAHDWDVVADENGGFLDTSFVPGRQHLGVTFTLTATGPLSGTSQAVFTDGNIAVRPNPSTLTINVAWAKFNGNTTCTGLPNQSGTVLNVTGSGFTNIKGTDNGQSLRVTAPPVSGHTFTSWTSASTTITTADGCIPGSDSNQSWTANYTPVATDAAAPVVNVSFPTPNGNNGWFTTSPVVGSVSAADVSNVTAISCTGATVGTITGLNTSSASAPLTVTGDGTHNVSCTATDGALNSGAAPGSSNTATVKVDATAPTATATATPPPNAAGWNNTDVTVTFAGLDALSGIDTCTAPATLSSEGTGLSASGTCTDLAGNVSTVATASGIKIDKTAPTDISFVGGPGDGSSYYFGSVPAAPTCTADGAISGLKTCTVTGHGAAIGMHTMTATATDNAGNTDSATRSYTVLAWTLDGFFAPVRMDALNTAKAGSTVPLKFEIFAGAYGENEQTSTSAVLSFQFQQVSCALASELYDAEDIEDYSTGGTVLRYDWTAGQFIQNWQTPKGKAGNCYRVTMTAQDGSKLIANFKLK